MTRVLIVGAGITGAVTASLLKCRLPQNSHIAVWELCGQAGWFPLFVILLNSTQLNSTENYGRRCLTPLSPHRNYILS